MIDIKKIIVPTDFSDSSRNAIKYASSFAKKFKASISLIYVIEPIVIGLDGGSIPILTDISTKEKLEDELKVICKEDISPSVKTAINVNIGKPFIEIIEFAEKEDADLIIIATHGHTGIEHLLFGSTAEKVVRKASCPVLSIKDNVLIKKT